MLMRMSECDVISVTVPAYHLNVITLNSVISDMYIHTPCKQTNKQTNKSACCDQYTVFT